MAKEIDEKGNRKISRRKATKYMGALAVGSIAVAAGTGIYIASSVNNTSDKSFDGIENQSEDKNIKKRILVLSSSARRNGNSSTLCDQFIKGAKEAGHSGEKIYLSGKDIRNCRGCGYCNKNNDQCVQKDDMAAFYAKIHASDIIVLASPMYYYTFCAQMKAFMDRTYAMEKTLKDKTFYLIAAMADKGEDHTRTMLDCFRKYLSCFKNLHEGGFVFGYGTFHVGDVEGTLAMQEAYEMGKNIV